MEEERFAGATTATATVMSGMGLAILIFAQGLLIWAVLNVLAIVAKTLIDIRDR